MTGNGSGPPSGDVTPLRPDQAIVDPEPAPTKPSGLHAAAITGLATFALLGIALVFALITLGWSAGSRRVLAACLVFTAVGFMASAATAVFAAARDTSPRRQSSRDA